MAKEKAPLETTYIEEDSQAAARRQLIDEIIQKTQESVFDNPQSFAHVWDVAQKLKGSDMLPPRIGKSPGSIMIIYDFAKRFGFPFYLVAQQVYIVYGEPAISGKFAIALANICKKFNDDMRWRWIDRQGNETPEFTEGGGCIAYNTVAATGEQLTMKLDWNDVQRWGWLSKDNSMWQKGLGMAAQMFRYRTTMFFLRAYAPEYLLGLQTVDEIADTKGLDFSAILNAPESFVEESKAHGKAAIDFKEMKKNAKASKQEDKKQEDEKPAEDKMTVKISDKVSAMIKAFSEIGIQTPSIAKKIGKPVGDFNNDDLSTLREWFKKKKVEHESRKQASKSEKFTPIKIGYDGGEVTVFVRDDLDMSTHQLSFTKLGNFVASYPEPEDLACLDGIKITDGKKIFPHLKNVVELNTENRLNSAG